MDPIDCIFFQLSKASQAAIRFWGQKIAHLKVTPVQGLVLLFLFNEDGVTSRRLGERAQLDSATLTGILDRMERMDLIKRRPNPDDRRAILVGVTEKGKGVGNELFSMLGKANQEFLEDLSSEENLMLRGLLKRVMMQHA